ncbi:MAG: hypothetical protein IPP57_07355 [Candidatus Obscuribacter sp.]|mgnify:FL=1|jgi:hypothetical protein|nr:hypothetical protein [Candidatus Obscuribacter sp.]MBK7840422.1 hypothetical protein [Candidatus Obscuribacter sp.]MBK9201618.1 hypothetical protein [Candidatus Obscuribacter sp.]MBK9619917.1 hypothetical protein [Candidatus Obscuribacter sp.]MBK9770625.1 hypothetical protein [Candidatus Obscuribacter sp.]
MSTALGQYATHIMPTEGTMELLSVSENGQYVVSLPATLKDHQQELERLLGKVFTGRPTSANNLALARQMSINWCISKCKQTGQSIDKCLETLA